MDNSGNRSMQLRSSSSTCSKEVVSCDVSTTQAMSGKATLPSSPLLTSCIPQMQRHSNGHRRQTRLPIQHLQSMEPHKIAGLLHLRAGILFLHNNTEPICVSPLYDLYDQCKCRGLRHRDCGNVTRGAKNPGDPLGPQNSSFIDLKLFFALLSHLHCP